MKRCSVHVLDMRDKRETTKAMTGYEIELAYHPDTGVRTKPTLLPILNTACRLNIPHARESVSTTRELKCNARTLY